MPSRPPQHKPQRPTTRVRKDNRPSASKRGYDEEWKRLRAAYLLTHPICVAVLSGGRRCGKPATCVDHHVSLEKGGTSEEANLRAYCHSCHARKTCALDNGFGHGRRG